jgi:hypothetical protein
MIDQSDHHRYLLLHVTVVRDGGHSHEGLRYTTYYYSDHRTVWEVWFVPKEIETLVRAAAASLVKKPTPCCRRRRPSNNPS